jgi:ubiquinone biosynthesis protein COQ9
MQTDLVPIQRPAGLAVPPAVIRSSIVRAALRVAEQGGGWDAVRVHDVAREAGVTLAELRRHFSDRDAIAEGYFDMADDALLALAERPGWGGLPVRLRVFSVVMAWLDALAPHRRLVRGMLGYKFQPEHIHLQVRGIMRISSTVQCMREVALLPSTGWRRELEEAGLTSMYLLTFSCWLTDGTPNAQRTRRLLERLLDAADRPALWLGLDRRA